MTATQHSAYDDDGWLRALQEELGMVCTVCNKATAATHVICGRCPNCRHQPMPTPCSPFCHVHKDDPDHRRWQWCRHRRRL